MRVVTIVSLGASAVLGLGALVMAKAVLPNMAAAKEPAGAAQAVGVPVVVAAKPLKFGDKLEAGSLTIVRLPQNAAPEGAFSTVEAVLKQDNGGAPVALTAIAAREPLLPTKLSGPGARASVAAEIAEGMRAFTIKVDGVTGVGGHALPGDRVDVVLTRDLTPDAQNRNFVSEVVLQNVRVLAVDLNADLASNKPATPNTATLEVDVPASQKLAIASDLGKLSLALRRTGSAEVADAGPIRAGTFSPGAGRAAAAPQRTSGPRRDYAPAGPRLIQVVELEGGKSQRPRRAPPAPAPVPAAPTTAAAPQKAG
ncbi:Flp pilus assembly protein CpaB [Phenylobacterium sp.]|jgi:pilus assembly protein CpaB|uniref:Flp pilus assembly protein CpaB n=1 Tax=Phenylobacterium sp. TaxID=1871053 RepID=UPI002F91F9BE